MYYAIHRDSHLILAVQTQKKIKITKCKIEVGLFSGLQIRDMLIFHKDENV